MRMHVFVDLRSGKMWRNTANIISRFSGKMRMWQYGYAPMSVCLLPTFIVLLL